MRRVIIESPYAGDVATNLRYLRECIRDCITLGESPYASHGLLPGALDDDDPEEREAGIRAGFAWREVADATVVYTDRGISRGMQYGIEHAESIGHPVEHRSLGGCWSVARYVREATAAKPYIGRADVTGGRRA